MDFYTLCNDSFDVVVSTQGGAVVKAQYKGVDILREHAQVESAFTILHASCFPLVPFANRIEGNTFMFENTTYEVFKNIDFDPLHVHGDGWLHPWQLHAHTSEGMSLQANIASTKNPYTYEARQHFSVSERAFTISLEVVNKGRTLPFGLGLHPYFPLTEHTMLQARAHCYWSEKERFLPHEKKPLDPAINFNALNAVPHRWLNNCFEGWDGHALIHYPHNGLNIHVQAPSSTYYFLFVSSRQFERDYNDDYFCFEPMTHCANAHKLPDLGGLRVLKKEQKLSLSMSLSPYFSQNP